jgi:Ribulose-5-phosphate 4-epimerase and related epimerases and aldolases
MRRHESVDAMTFAFLIAREPSPALSSLLDQIDAELRARGWTRTDDEDDAKLVFNIVDTDNPRPFRRHARGTYAATLYDGPVDDPSVLGSSYPLLVRSLANVVLAHTGDAVWFTTMERGNYRASGTPLAATLLDRLLPLATARLVIENEFRRDLEPSLWEGDAHTDEIRSAGERIDELGLLPAPFPIEDLLNERDLRHVKRLYGIGGLSYGNLSARRDERRFWMSASGVDKSKLETPGRDILLVSDYDAEHGVIVLSVPPDVEPRRVSVDAIEHWMIYQAHPDIGAILHVHAWLDGIPTTEFNFPCGTEELAVSVAEALAAEPDPAHAVIGLTNHGITATGESLSEILDRIGSSLRVQIPMA